MDWARPLASATRQILDKGRVVTFRKLPTGSDDDAVGSAPSGVPVNRDLPAVFVHPTSLSSLGYAGVNSDYFKDCSQVAIVADNGADDLTTFHKVIDGGDEWGIKKFDKLKPGTVSLLYFLGLTRP